MTHDRAVQILEEGGPLADLAEAVAFLADDPGTRPDELLRGLDHPGVVADQAAIALHRITGVPLSSKREPVTSPSFWEKKLRPEGVTARDQRTLAGDRGHGDRRAAHAPRTATCAVLMPFERRFEQNYERIYEPAVRAAGLEVVRAGGSCLSGSLVSSLNETIRLVDVVVADLSTKDSNVFYEVGYAHALGKPVVLTAESMEDIPSDLRHLRVLIYDTASPDWAEELRAFLTGAIAERLAEIGRSV